MRRISVVFALAIALSGCSAQQNGNGPVTGNGWSTQRHIGDAVATISAPERTETGFSGLLVKLTKNGAPLNDAHVSAKTSMPQHRMEGPQMVGQPKGSGAYWLPGNLMKGEWKIDLSIKDPNGSSYSDSIDTTVP